MAVTDSELMTRYVTGDRTAFAELYDRLSPPIFRYLCRLTRDQARAEDLLQQTFLKVHRARSAYNEGADPKPWMFAIAHRTFIDDTRKRKRAPAAPIDAVPESATTSSDGTKTAGDAIDDAKLAARVRDAIDDLPESQRTALVLTVLCGLSQAEAAAALGSTTGAIKLRVHRAYENLRRRLSARETSEIAS